MGRRAHRGDEPVGEPAVGAAAPSSLLPGWPTRPATTTTPYAGATATVATATALRPLPWSSIARTNPARVTLTSPALSALPMVAAPRLGAVRAELGWAGHADRWAGWLTRAAEGGLARLTV